MQEVTGQGCFAINANVSAKLLTAKTLTKSIADFQRIVAFMMGPL